MTCLKREVKVASEALKCTWRPKLKDAPLIIGWDIDAARLGFRVVQYLNKKLRGQSFCEIEPADFFPLAGVTIEDNLVQFPESKFYACAGKNLTLFHSSPPNFDWYRFLDLTLEAARDCCRVGEVYIIGGMISLGIHTAPRELRGTFNFPEFQNSLSEYTLSATNDYETPPGQRPTLNSFFLWAARRLNIPAVALWVPVPYYLVGSEDPAAQKRVIEFLNQRLNLGLDLSDLDRENEAQNQKIADLRGKSGEVDEWLKKLENNQGLSEEDSQKLAKEIDQFLKKR
jgi:proteasome assembly chaperone (PAC2) family protein